MTPLTETPKREIKFRAWDAANNVMYTHRDFFVSFEGEVWGTYEGNNDEANIYNANGEKPILMQFTGLLDKNGKEIYDGDVVQRTDEIATVFFNTSMGAWDFELPGGDCESMITGDGWHPEAHEVIGNVFETPELLTPQP